MILGIDLALNHSGFVALDDDGAMDWWHFVSDKPAHAKGLDEDVATTMPYTKEQLKRQGSVDDRESINAKRLAWWSDMLPWIVGRVAPTHVGLEDYAISAASNSAYQIGEVGGAARLASLKSGAVLRLIDPMTVKMFAAHMGNAEPVTVAEEVRTRWPETQVWDTLADLPRIDLACAYAVARMVYVETKLRAGTMTLDELEHDKERAVFCRCTKANPVSLLGREWISL
jgi:Holliday junction resolvasome RuvABC endonuclease subunit